MDDAFEDEPEHPAHAISWHERMLRRLNNEIRQRADFGDGEGRRRAEEARNRHRARLNLLKQRAGAFRRDADKAAKGVRWAHQFAEAASAGALALALLAFPAAAQPAATWQERRDAYERDRFVERSRDRVERGFRDGQDRMARERRDWRERSDDARREAPRPRGPHVGQ